MTTQRFFREGGGDILAGERQRLTQAEATALRELYQDEIVAAYRAGNARALIEASRHARDLTQALSAAERWRRASGPLPWTR